MSDLEPNTREETFLAALSDDNITPPTPVTREELFLAKLAGEDVTPPTPATRTELFLQAAIDAGGGSSVTVEPLEVTQNGTTTAPEGTAYSPVTVNVPPSLPLVATIVFDSGGKEYAVVEFPEGFQFSDKANNRYLFKVHVDGVTEKTGDLFNAYTIFVPYLGFQAKKFYEPGSYLNLECERAAILIVPQPYDQSSTDFHGVLRIYDANSLL